MTADRLIDSSRDNNGCRIWTASTLRSGYGRLTVAAHGRTVAVETISLWRHGHACPNDANMAALRAVFPAAALDALVAPDRWSTTPHLQAVGE